MFHAWISPEKFQERFYIFRHLNIAGPLQKCKYGVKTHNTKGHLLLRTCRKNPGQLRKMADRIHEVRIKQKKNSPGCPSPTLSDVNKKLHPSSSSSMWPLTPL